MSYQPDAWVEVNLAAIRNNTKQVKEFIGQNVRLMAVVKADAYGHGAVEASKAMLEAGADALAVTRLEEAEILRNAGITAPILVFSQIQPSSASKAIELGVELTVCSSNLVDAVSKAAVEAEKTVNLHLKIDTGMGRLGVLPTDAAELAKTIVETPGVALAGTYTHFATALEKDLTQAKLQLQKFNEALDSIKRCGIDPGIVHASNSAAILRLPEARFDMVRPGTILYGQYPSNNVPKLLKLENTWTLKTRISQVKTVPAGYSIGYGAEFTTKQPTKIAVIPIGWADGLTLLPESAARRGILRLMAAKMRHEPVLSVTIRGKKVPVIGRVAMQMCSVDVTTIENVADGDEVIVPARRVTTSPLIPRVYVG